jgi:hypothetical protein
MPLVSRSYWHQLASAEQEQVQCVQDHRSHANSANDIGHSGTECNLLEQSIQAVAAPDPELTAP